MLKTYTFDYDKVIEFKQDRYMQKVKEQCLCPLPGLFALCGACSLIAYHCYDKENIEEEVRAQHLAVTRDGIRYVVDKHKTGCRVTRDEVQGKVSKTVPYDKMTDCDIEEPAGAHMVCGCLFAVEDVLTKVQARRSSRGGGGGGAQRRCAGASLCAAWAAGGHGVRRGQDGGRARAEPRGHLGLRDLQEGGARGPLPPWAPGPRRPPAPHLAPCRRTCGR